MSEHYSTHAPVCPYCDYKHEHDDGYFYDEGLTEYQCERCDKVFNLSVYTLTSWTTTVREAPETKP
jgi:transposase-like protein